MTRISGLARGAWRVLEPKLADTADLLMLAIIVGSVALSLYLQSWILTGHLLVGSMLGFALCYLITSRALRTRKELGINRIFISLCAMLSAIWLFEIVYHYYGWDQWNLIPNGFSSLSLSTTAKPYPLVWSLVIVALVGVGVRFMGINRWFFLTLALGIITMELWKGSGFPSYFSPEWWPHKRPWFPLLPLEFTSAKTELAAATISWWGGFFNSLVKVVWCVLPATLFLTRQNLGATLTERLRHPWPALRSLLMPWTEWGEEPSAPAGEPLVGPADAR